jgi:hypothetical protein
MTAVQFQGHFTVIYPDHLDASTGKTLVAVPGQSYTTAAAPGRNAGLPAIPGDGRWGTTGFTEAFRAPILLPASPPATEGEPAPENEE